ncbi:MAG: hypothetical protein WD045_04020 [Pirellulaceae bacterium]
MLAACLLLTAATVGVDFGWQSTDKGELEYIIQFEPELIEQLKAGKAVSYQVPPEMEGRVRAFRVQIGTEDLPKAIPAGFTQQSKGEPADMRPQLLAVNTPILSTPPVPLSAARREIQASIDAAADQVAQYTPRSTRTLPQYSTQSGNTQAGSNQATATNTQAQSQPTQQPSSSSLNIPRASERYGDSTTPSRFNDGQSTNNGSSTSSSNPPTPNSTTSGQFSNNSGASNSSTSNQQAPDLGRFSSGGSYNPTGTNNNGSSSTGSTSDGSTNSAPGSNDWQGTNNGQTTSGGQTGSNDGSSNRGRWGNRGPQTDHQPLNSTNDPSLVSPVNQDQWTTQQPQQNNQQQGNGQQGNGQPPLAGGGYGNPNMNVPDSWQTGQNGNNPNYNQNPQQNYQAPPLYNSGNQGNYGQFPSQQQQQPPNQPPYQYPNQNGYQNQGQVPYVASLPPQQPPPAATPVSTGSSKPEEKPASPSDTPAPSEPEVITEVKVEAPEWWFMVAIGFMMSLFFNFWSWKVSQEIRQKYDDLLEDVRDMRSLPEA